jgi:hypothetical protein
MICSTLGDVDEGVKFDSDGSRIVTKGLNSRDRHSSNNACARPELPVDLRLHRIAPIFRRQKIEL